METQRRGQPPFPWLTALSMPPDFGAAWFCACTCVHWRRSEHRCSTIAELQDLSSWPLNIYLYKKKHVQQGVTNRRPFSRAAQWPDHSLTLKSHLQVSGLNCFGRLCGKCPVTGDWPCTVTDKLIFQRSSKLAFIQMWKRDFLTCSSIKATKLFFQQAVNYKQQGVAAKLLLK